METGWYTDRALRKFLEANGTKGILLVHFAREKLGEHVSHAAINADIRRRRGHAYSDRHLRRLSSERRRLIARWSAEQCQRGGKQGGDILEGAAGSSVYIESCLTTAASEQTDRGESPLVLGSQPAPPAPAPALAARPQRKTLPKEPTIADIPVFETARDKAQSLMRKLKHFEILPQAHAVHRRMLHYERILAELYAERARLPLKTAAAAEARAASATAHAAGSGMDSATQRDPMRVNAPWRALRRRRRFFDQIHIERTH